MSQVPSVSMRVEVVVAGAVGDLVASMLGDLSVNRRPASTVLVADGAALPGILDTLARAGAEILSVAEMPTPGG